VYYAGSSYGAASVAPAGRGSGYTMPRGQRTRSKRLERMRYMAQRHRFQRVAPRTGPPTRATRTGAPPRDLDPERADVASRWRRAEAAELEGAGRARPSPLSAAAPHWRQQLHAHHVRRAVERGRSALGRSRSAAYGVVRHEPRHHQRDLLRRAESDAVPGLEQ